MSKVLQWRTIITALLASLVFATAALAQMPINPWKKAAPFPEPDEELYGAAVNGKMYVIGGWDDGKARGANYEYDPATDKWTKKQSMPRPAHHAALTAALLFVVVDIGSSAFSADSTALPPQNTITMNFQVNDGPFAGRANAVTAY